MMNRRLFVSLLASIVFAPQARSESALNMTVFKDPNCGCCGAWVNHVRKAGLTVSVVENEAMDDVKQRYGVPEGLTSCHTAEIGDYIVEGHVPSAEIIRLLKERPVAKGLVVAGMPKNSPGSARVFRSDRGRRGTSRSPKLEGVLTRFDHEIRTAPL